MFEPEDITEEEREVIEELKKKIEHELPPALLKDKSLYYRFLKARDFNIENAEALIRKGLSHRRKFRIDEYVLKDYKPSPILVEYFPSTFICFDKEGALVRYADVGNMDCRGLFTMFTFEQIAQYVTSYLLSDIENLTENGKKLGKSLTKFSWIVNIENLSLFKATYKKALEAYYEGAIVYQDCFPERLKALYIINSSPYFSMAFSVIKTAFSYVLLQKIHVLGKDWKEKLLEQIDADVLPAFLGGNRTDPDGDPLCSSFIVHGKKIPEELYLKKKSLKQESGIKRLTVTRSSFSEVKVSVSELNTFIEWEFETASRDIGFGLFYEDESKLSTEIKELIPLQIFEATVETGIYQCRKTGRYILVFDNSHSWLRSKDLYYRIHLVKPGENNLSLT